MVAAPSRWLQNTRQILLSLAKSTGKMPQAFLTAKHTLLQGVGMQEGEVGRAAQGRARGSHLTGSGSLSDTSWLLQSHSNTTAPGTRGTTAGYTPRAETIVILTQVFFSSELLKLRSQCGELL